jgi:hypothetical protein
LITISTKQRLQPRGDAVGGYTDPFTKSFSEIPSELVSFIFENDINLHPKTERAEVSVLINAEPYHDLSTCADVVVRIDVHLATNSNEKKDKAEKAVKRFIEQQLENTGSPSTVEVTIINRHR